MPSTERQKRWQKEKALTPEKLSLAREVLYEIINGRDVAASLRAHPLAGGGVLEKAALVAAYNELIANGEIVSDKSLLEQIRMKPTRTLSGVATVTVLTKPYPCPGKCIFCPDDVCMPKSYLPGEPGAMRGLENDFDPFTQVRSRLTTLENLGHPTDKIELLILGGTWSAYPRDYQEWFIKRCFDAMNEAPLAPPVSREVQRETGGGQEGGGILRSSAENDGDEGDLSTAQAINETAPHRNVGLVIETRPDEITPKELAWLRYLGVTKVQMGAQSLDDRILEMNQRGHNVAATRHAVSLLRAAGFKIVLHWMPNLYGATPASDRADFARLWDGFCPDEIKIYPNQLLRNTGLYQVWQRGEFHPYTTVQLVDLIADVKPIIPRYCRVNRIIRDIPSTNVVDGNKRTSLRQDIHKEMQRRGTKCSCIRCREVRGTQVDASTLRLDDLTYMADSAEEHFTSFVTPDDRIAGFIRLSLPLTDSPATGLTDLDGAALIREVHVYGQSLPVGAEQNGAAQHSGLGTRLLQEADKIALEHGYRRMAVISAVGTRKYYLERGYGRGELYLVKNIR